MLADTVEVNETFAFVQFMVFSVVCIIGILFGIIIPIINSYETRIKSGKILDILESEQDNDEADA